MSAGIKQLDIKKLDEKVPNHKKGPLTVGILIYHKNSQNQI